MCRSHKLMMWNENHIAPPTLCLLEQFIFMHTHTMLEHGPYSLPNQTSGEAKTLNMRITT